MQMKMQLTDGGGRVALAYDECGKRIVRVFTVRRDGKTGYVQEWFRDTNTWKQVCERLTSMGNTLMATDATLAEVIRREYKRMVAAEARREAKEWLS
jgi:hypothetical protein